MNKRPGLPRALVILAGVAAGLAVAWAVGALRPRGSAARENMPRLVSDADGTLRAVCIHYRADFHEACIETYADLFGGVVPGCRVYVAVEEMTAFRQFADALGRRGVKGVELVPVVTHLPITAWAKDRFGTFACHGRPVLGLPPGSHVERGPRAHDHMVPLRLGSTVDRLGSFTLPFRFDGGDLLADEHTAFVSANFLYRNPLPDAEAKERLLQQIGSVLGRKVVPLGNTPADVPDHHIGMVLTPLGEGRVAVADPALGLELLDSRGEAVDIGIDRDPSHYLPFENVATAVAEAGCRVIRVPMLFTAEPRVYVTYNNAIIETRDARRRIYMPTYRIPALDGAAREIYEAAGLEVVPVDVSQVYRYTGSLRCMVGIVARSH